MPEHPRSPDGAGPRDAHREPPPQQAPYGPTPQAPYPYPSPAAYGPTPPVPSSSPPPYGPATQAPYPYPPPAPYGSFPLPVVPPKPNPMPDGPREYPQLLRGPRQRWWKPLVSLLLVVALAIPLMILAFVPVLGIALIAGVDDPLSWMANQLTEDLSQPGGYAYLLLSLAILIPVAMWSIWIVHGVRPRFLTSVAGGTRWRWAVRCILTLIPVWFAYLGISLLLDDSPGGPVPAQWVLLLALSVFLMPFQAAGEEYLFRGWLLQNVGSWFRRPAVSLAVGTVLSAGLFSLAHGSLDVWVLADLSAMAVTTCILTWRTGGLEAAIAFHAVNNVGVSVLSIATGTWQDSFIDTTTTSTPTVFAVSLLVDLVACVLLFWQAKRAGLQRLYQPQPAPPVLPVGPPAPAILAPPYGR